MENENENRDHNPLKDNQDDSWIVAALTTAFVAGVGQLSLQSNLSARS